MIALSLLLRACGDAARQEPTHFPAPAVTSTAAAPVPTATQTL
ncbi:MAG: hypothetical protein WA821_13945 [Anaerolineales bacterium]